VLGQNWIFLLVMAAGSIVGTFIGGRLLGFVPTYILLPLLAAVLVISAVKSVVASMMHRRVALYDATGQ